MKRVPWLTAIGMLLWTSAVPGQKPSDLPRTKASAELTLFNLDVIVTGPDGNPVHGLAADDFEVVHDRKKVVVTNLREERGAAPAAPVAAPEASRGPGKDAGSRSAAPAEAPPARPRSHLAILLDHLDLSEPTERKESFDAISGLLRKALARGDDAMVVSWNGMTQTIVPFTSDLSVLDRAIEKAAGMAVRQSSEGTEIDVIAFNDAMAIRAGLAPDSTMNIHVLETQAFQNVKAKAGVMRGIIGTLAGMEGRKVLVLATRRFSRYAGREFGGEGIDTKSVRDSVIDAANAAGVTLYTIDARPFDPGLPTASSSRESNPSTTAPGNNGAAMANQLNEGENLALMARSTGGVMGSVRDVGTVSERISSDLESWYSLGYPAPSGSSRSAPVSVRVKGRKVDVRTRQTFVEKSADEQMSERVLSHLFVPDPRSRIRISVRGKAVPVKKGVTRLSLEVRIPIGSLVLLPTSQGASGSFSVLAAAASPDGSLSETGRQRRPFEIPRADLERARGSHFTYELSVDVQGPGARVCVGVFDDTGQEVGFAVLNVS
jgi:VWFA-related protein